MLQETYLLVVPKHGLLSGSRTFCSRCFSAGGISPSDPVRWVNSLFPFRAHLRPHCHQNMPLLSLGRRTVQSLLTRGIRASPRKRHWQENFQLATSRFHGKKIMKALLWKNRDYTYKSLRRFIFPKITPAVYVTVAVHDTRQLPPSWWQSLAGRVMYLPLAAKWKL